MHLAQAQPSWQIGADMIRLLVKVIPKARQEEVVGWEGERLKVKVTAPPEKGAANRAVVRLLARTFDIAQSRIILVKGETSRQKEFLMEVERVALLNRRIFLTIFPLPILKWLLLSLNKIENFKGDT